MTPTLFYEYRGLKIFHVHHKDEHHQELYYWYTIYPENLPSNEKQWYPFDIRDLGVETDNNKMLPETHKEILRSVVDSKTLPPKNWLEDNNWKFRPTRSRRA